MGVDLHETIDVLNELVRTLRDDQQNFLTAAEHVANSDLKVMLMDFSTERARFLGDLQNEIERLGEPEPVNSGSITGTLRRGWMGLKAALASNRDEAVLAECEKAEDAAINHYDEVLKHKIPRYIREIIERQIEQIGRERARLAEARLHMAHV